MAAKMVAKFVVASVTRTAYGENLVLTAVTNGAPEDNTFASATPFAKLEMTITNKELLGKFNPDEKFLVHFTPAN